MDQRIILKINNSEIKYEYRHNRVLLIFTNFNPLSFPSFSDQLENDCEEIKSVEKLIRYDDGTGAIVATMRIGYNIQKSNNEIETVFNSFFSNQLV